MGGCGCSLTSSCEGVVQNGESSNTNYSIHYNIVNYIGERDPEGACSLTCTFGGIIIGAFSIPIQIKNHRSCQGSTQANTDTTATPNLGASRVQKHQAKQLQHNKNTKRNIIAKARPGRPGEPSNLHQIEDKKGE